MIKLGLLVMTLVGATAPAIGQPTGEPAYVDNVHTPEEVRRMAFMTAFQAAHMAELGAFCVANDASVERLTTQLRSISARAQQRNPDIDLTSLEATTGLDVSRFSTGEAELFCADTKEAAVANFTAAMTELRKFTKKWR